jgi:hypothetical protein
MILLVQHVVKDDTVKKRWLRFSWTFISENFVTGVQTVQELKYRSIRAIEIVMNHYCLLLLTTAKKVD